MEEFRKLRTIAITEELRIQLNLLAEMETDYVSDLILALIDTANGIKQDPEEMPLPVRTCYIYWLSDGNINRILIIIT